MIALYVTYLVEDYQGKAAGSVSNIQAKTKGRAPAVADVPRMDRESVVRYSLPNNNNFQLSIILSCSVNAERQLVADTNVLLNEDITWSTQFYPRIEEL
jgi:hypothetical protein